MSSAQLPVLVLAVLIALLVLGVVLLVSRRGAPKNEAAGAASPVPDETTERRGLQPEVASEPVVREPALRAAPLDVLELRPLAPDTRRHYLEAWEGVETLFLDSPVLALSAADALLTQLLDERGLPTDARAQQHVLSAPHAQLRDAFRAGHAVEQQNTTENADEEQVRTAMDQFRRVFHGLVTEDEPAAANVGRHESR